MLSHLKESGVISEKTSAVPWRLQRSLNYGFCLKGNSSPKICCVEIKDNTFNRLFPKYVGPNSFIKGEIDCQSSRFLQNPTLC